MAAFMHSTITTASIITLDLFVLEVICHTSLRPQASSSALSCCPQLSSTVTYLSSTNSYLLDDGATTLYSYDLSPSLSFRRLSWCICAYLPPLQCAESGSHDWPAYADHLKRSNIIEDGSIILFSHFSSCQTTETGEKDE